MSHTAAKHVTKLDPPFSGVGESSRVMMTNDGGNDTEQEEGGVATEKPKKTDKSSPKKRAAGNTGGEATSPKKKRAAAKGKVAIKTPGSATKTVANSVETIAVVKSENDTSEGQVGSTERPSTPEAQTVKDAKTPKTPKTPKSPDVDNNVVEANDATPKQARGKTHPAKPKANPKQSPIKGKRAGAEKVADKVVLPTKWSEASEADKMLVRMKEAGRPWSEIRVKWYEMTGQDTAPSTLPNR
ncbi:MAG: hypothetical protein LQ337_001356 [Flavoplaca oasis]|nr:MAG: hypothetical protein LQ337_001356 [Flavoplaca oasis]